MCIIGQVNIAEDFDPQHPGDMGDLTVETVPIAATGDVAYLKMPIPLSSMADMGKFLDKAYGPDAICVEDPKGWLKISKPQTAINGFEMAQRLERTNDALQKATQ